MSKLYTSILPANFLERRLSPYFYNIVYFWRVFYRLVASYLFYSLIRITSRFMGICLSCILLPNEWKPESLIHTKNTRVSDKIPSFFFLLLLPLIFFEIFTWVQYWKKWIFSLERKLLHQGARVEQWQQSAPVVNVGRRVASDFLERKTWFNRRLKFYCFT